MKDLETHIFYKIPDAVCMQLVQQVSHACIHKAFMYHPCRHSMYDIKPYQMETGHARERCMYIVHT